MQRTDIHPWEWGKQFGFSQAVEISGPSRVLYCSGQTGVDENGNPPTGGMAEQVQTALANLQAVLAGAGMSTADIVKVTIYATDIDELFAAYGSFGEVFGANLPASTVIGVTRLAFPELKVEIEATAAV